MRLMIKFGIVLFIFILVASPARAGAATVSDIADQLVCQCGCNMVLSNCSHIECFSREAMTASIEQKLAQNQPAEEIVQSFVAQYGEQVLAAPRKQGFNLTAWVTPFAALLFGGGVIYAALKKWVRQGRTDRSDEPPEEVDEEYRRRLEKELKEFN